MYSFGPSKLNTIHYAVKSMLMINVQQNQCWSDAGRGVPKPHKYTHTTCIKHKIGLRSVLRVGNRKNRKEIGGRSSEGLRGAKMTSPNLTDEDGRL